MPTDEEIKVALIEARAHHVPQVYVKTLAAACNELRSLQKRARCVTELEITFAAITHERDLAEARARAVTALCARIIKEIADEGYFSYAEQLNAELATSSASAPAKSEAQKEESSKAYDAVSPAPPEQPSHVDPDEPE